MAQQTQVQLQVRMKMLDDVFHRTLTGTFRQEILENYMFESLAELRMYVRAWMWMYNNERPHSALENLLRFNSY